MKSLSLIVDCEICITRSQLIGQVSETGQAFPAGVGLQLMLKEKLDNLAWERTGCQASSGRSLKSYLLEFSAGTSPERDSDLKSL